VQKELMCGASASSAGQAEQCAGSCETPSSDLSAGVFDSVSTKIQSVFLLFIFTMPMVEVFFFFVDLHR
jgi:hypothetical protein